MLFLALQQQHTKSAMFFFTLEELIQISPARTVTSVTRANQTNVSAQPWTCWEKIFFDQGFASKHQILSFENQILGKNVEGRGNISKILDVWGVETFSDQSITQTHCDMAVILTRQ